MRETIFNKEDEEFSCKAASTVKDAKALIELGFSYVCEIEDIKLFRKHK